MPLGRVLGWHWVRGDLGGRTDQVARVGGVSDGSVGLSAADPFSKEIARIFHVGNVSDLEFTATETLKEG